MKEEDNYQKTKTTHDPDIFRISLFSALFPSSQANKISPKRIIV